MNYLKSFVPWIGFAIVSTQADWRYSALVGLVLAGGLLLLQRRGGKPWDTLIIELSATIFFVLLTAYAFADPTSPLHPYVGTLSDGWLALTAWGSLAIRQPFTLGIARTMAPREVWNHPRFRRVNVVITAVWAASFTASLLAGGLLLTFAPHATVALIVIKVLGFVVPIAFTVRYTRGARAAAQTAAG
ncbi:MAG TPA: hypothetical protein VG674_16800 [Amycolatopsis sp.]|nr:hypothetical protein [Amycolatopsis sp.]